MAVETDEQQVEQIKIFWNAHKVKIIGGFIVLLIIFFTQYFYKQYNLKNSEEASQLYQEILIVKVENFNAIEESVTLLKRDYNSTPYAARAAIYFSKILVEQANNNAAIEELIWAGSNSPEKSIKSMSYFYLSNLYLAEKKLDEAMGAANKIITKGYVGLVNDLKGDIYKAMGNKKSASEFYQKALNYFQGQGEFYKVIQNKKDALGQ